MSDQVGVLGAGAWGTTLAVLLADAQRPVSLWTRSPETAERLAHARGNERYLPGVVFPPNLRVVTDDAYLGEPHRFYVVAVPSEHVRSTVLHLRTVLRPGAPILSVVKGIEEGTHLRMSEVIAEELPDRPIAVLSGPNLAREIAAGKPAGSVIASPDAELAAELAAVLSSDRFRVYTNPDVIGVELGGALKNVIAIAAGVVEGTGLGHNALAALITRGLAEISRLAVAAGGRRDTLAGLSGLGDLVLTCTGALSRNRHVGIELARGRTLDEVLAGMKTVAEGVRTTDAALALGKRHGVELPITAQVAELLAGRKDARTALYDLMLRPQRSEAG